jgi:4-hydroxyphenylpyruvate dioxygenase
MPGEGNLPILDFVRAVTATGYDGYLSLEVFNDQFRGGSPKQIAVDGRRSLLALMDDLRRGEPAGRAPVLPGRAGVEGVEFIEFAADEAEGLELETVLRTLGFAPFGRHIHKDVALWRQGTINLVINTEREGFAHACYVMHGTSVCDIGLRVEDAGSAVGRARALLAAPFEQPTGPGELRIPAVRGVGGGVIHFIDGTSDLSRVWDIEFDTVEIAPASAAGLIGIDHLAQTMNYDEMLTWVLFYTTIFETHRAAMVDVIDPAGLVRSQAIENVAGTLRLTLNGAENHRTLAGHFITESFGSGVQHIAFGTADIFATARALRENGFSALRISANYYDDLAARFPLDAGLLDLLRSENVLYDRDEAGEYFQLYSPNHGDGFFFEIVERRNGYRGYGAPNAVFRIAAQKRTLRPAAIPRAC